MQILIVTDQTMFGQAWADFLIKRHLAVQAATCSTPLAVELAARLQPQMIILDMQSNGIEDQQLITALKSAATKAQIILILSGREPRTLIQYLIDNGVVGLLSQQSSIEDFCLCAHSIAKRKIYIAAELHQIFNKRLKPGEIYTGICLLSMKELEIVKLIVEGLSSKKIAIEMGLSHKTIDAHRYNISKKLKIKNRIALINLFTSHPEQVGQL